MLSTGACRRVHLALVRYRDGMQLYGSLENYLRVVRKKCGLTQHDVAFLLDEKVARVEMYENRSALPHARSAIGLEAILDEPLQMLFGGLAEGIRAGIVARARVLLQSMSDQVTSENAERLETLARIAKVDEYQLPQCKDTA
jgi:transcriptional regulator with XRE-family HTH domain